MFLPIGDTPNPLRFRAWVTWALMAVNIGVYLLFALPQSFVHAAANDPRTLEWLRVLTDAGMTSREASQSLSVLTEWDLQIFAHGFRSSSPELVDIFTAMFMHAGFFHLAGNMLFLWIYGDNVEHRLGRLGYLAAYLGLGVFSTAVYAALAGSSPVPLVGASGAISGVLGMYALMFPGNKVKVFFFLFPILMRTVLVPAYIVLGAFLLLDNVIPLVVGAGGGVAYGAHIGGFMGGVGLAFWGERRRWRWPWSAAVLPRRTVVDGPIPNAEDLARAVRQGDRKRAVSLLARTPRAELEQIRADQIVVLADWLESAGYEVAAEALLRRGLARRLAPRDQARIHLALGLARLRAGQGPLAWQHLRRVASLEPDDETAREAMLALDQLGVR